MIGPNLPQSTFRPVVSPTDPTMAAPGFFDQPIFPVFSSAGLDGSLPLLPMEPLNLPGVPSTGSAPGGQGSLFGINLDKNGLPQLTQASQENYLKDIISSFLQSSIELQSGFSQFLGGGIQQ